MAAISLSYGASCVNRLHARQTVVASFFSSSLSSAGPCPAPSASRCSGLFGLLLAFPFCRNSSLPGVPNDSRRSL